MSDEKHTPFNQADFDARLAEIHEQETFFTPVEAPASENFKMAVKFATLAGLGAIQGAASIASDQAERRAGRQPMPRTHFTATGLVVGGTMGAISELKAGLSKRRSSR